MSRHSERGGAYRIRPTVADRRAFSRVLSDQRLRRPLFVCALGTMPVTPKYRRTLPSVQRRLVECRTPSKAPPRNLGAGNGGFQLPPDAEALKQQAMERLTAGYAAAGLVRLPREKKRSGRTPVAFGKAAEFTCEGLTRIFEDYESRMVAPSDIRLPILNAWLQYDASFTPAPSSLDASRDAGSLISNRSVLSEANEPPPGSRGRGEQFGERRMSCANRQKTDHRVTLCRGLSVVASGTYAARTPGNAVHQFRREHRLRLVTDYETGGWLGVTIESVK